MTTQQKIDTIRANAETVAVQHELLNACVADERLAAKELLEAVWEAVAPAIHALSSRFLVARSARGCQRHGMKPGTDEYTGMRGLLVLPSVILAVDGLWWVDVAGDRTCEDNACATYVWELIHPEALLRAVPVSQLVDGLADVVAEQVTRGRSKRAHQFTVQARKLRALADLLVTETRE